MEKRVLTPEEKKEKARLRSAAWRAADPKRAKASVAASRDHDKRKIQRVKYYQANKEKILAASAEWRKANPEKVSNYLAKWVKENPDRRREIGRNWARENKAQCSVYTAAWSRANRDKRCESSSRWAKANPEKNAARVAMRNAAKILATPGWASIVAINEIYADASLKSRETDVAWHVDHVIPLRSELVCGLHCEQNMQVLPAQENIIKGNRFWPDMP